MMTIWIIKFINRNTIMNNSILACIKSAFIVAPLFIGLLSYPYATVAFCKALLLYAAVLAFDMGVRTANSVSSRDVGILLHIFQILIFLTAVILSVFGLIGFFNNEILYKYIVKYTFVERFIYIFVFLQAAWYFIEFLALTLSEILSKYITKTPISISQANDDVYNL